MSILAVENPTYKPAMRVINNITNMLNAEVTTTFNHGYLTGTVARLHIPLGYGIVQADSLYGVITVTGNTTFTIDIDTSKFDIYITPTTFPLNYQYPNVVPIGEINSMLTAAVQNVLV